MKTNKDYYKLFARDILTEISANKSNLESFKRTRSYYVSQLKAYSKIIHNYCDITFEDIINSTLSKVLEQYDLCMFPLTGGLKLCKDDAVRITIGLIETNRIIKKTEDTIKRLKNQLVDEKSYNVFLKTYNQLIKEAIIYKGYEYNFMNNISSVFVLRKKRYTRDDKAEGLATVHNIKAVNWGESNRNKAKIIAEGKVPFKSIKDEQGNIIGDNGGEKWLVPFTDDYGYWIAWDKKKCTIPNKGLYSFDPARNLIVEMQKAKADEKIVANYIIG